MHHLKTFESESLKETIYFKVIKGPHPKKPGKIIELGLAFRTAEAPVGYLPFFAKRDFDCNGKVDFLEEWVFSHVSFGISGAASPHIQLVKRARDDIHFTEGNDSGDRDNITDLVKKDATAKAINLGAEVFLNGVMNTLGGQVAGGFAKTMVKSKVAQFIVSNSIQDSISNELKKQAGLSQ